MKLISLLFVSIFIQSMTLFQFTSDSDISNWRILDDVVMGGRSNGNFKLNSNGHGEYSGEVSIENNGGFSSLRYYFDTVNSSDYSKFKIRVKGDGKTYQFRVKDAQSNRYSYIHEFKTSEEWQIIEIPFSSMYASFRGYRLDIPNFKGNQMEEIAFLIGNKKEERFKLLIDKITLE